MKRKEFWCSTLILVMTLMGMLARADFTAVGLNDMVQEYHVNNFEFEVINDNGFFPKDHIIMENVRGKKNAVSRIIFFRGHVFSPDVGAERSQGSYYATQENNLILQDYNNEEGGQFMLSLDVEGHQSFLTLSKEEYLNETVCYMDINANNKDYGQHFWTDQGSKPFEVTLADRMDRDVKVHRQTLTHTINRCQKDDPNFGYQDQYGFVQMKLNYKNLEGGTESARLTCMRMWFYFAVRGARPDRRRPRAEIYDFDENLIHHHGCGGRFITVGDVATALNGLRAQPVRRGRGLVRTYDYTSKGLLPSFLKFSAFDWRISTSAGGR